LFEPSVPARADRTGCGRGHRPLLRGFLFGRDRAHPHLHSFPTRRSSDLAGNVSNARMARTAPLASGDARAPGKPRTRCSSYASRSEEHTSELQSLAYLVCRLLLEKKKALAF